MKRARGDVRRLARVIGELQSMVGSAREMHYNDRDGTAFARAQDKLKEAFDLCVATLGEYDPASYDPAFDQKTKQPNLSDLLYSAAELSAWVIDESAGPKFACAVIAQRGKLWAHNGLHKLFCGDTTGTVKGRTEAIKRCIGQMGLGFTDEDPESVTKYWDGYPDTCAPGTQIVYMPTHAEGNINHCDCKEGFVTSIKGDIVFCRYWRARGSYELRTLINSEATPIQNIILKKTHDQDTVNGLLGMLCAEPVHVKPSDETPF